MRMIVVVVTAALLVAGMAYAQRPAATDYGQVSENMMETKVKLLNVTSPAFEDNGRIPVRYTGDGDDMSPPLRWQGAPEGVAEYAVICEDPDAPGGTFIHWVMYNIPPGYDRLDEGIRQEAELDNGAMQGKTDFGSVGYGGPAPPRGKLHRYEFTVYALGERLNLPPGLTRDELVEAMEGHVLAKGTITGLYGR
ncbi:MAG: putative kinase inhibitor protein [Methanocella sp. PtaU1.Bin125]|nr:MAG: putative kinase inhibitor protein [Methanocella sp. PtaU1.Bin125]